MDFQQSSSLCPNPFLMDDWFAAVQGVRMAHTFPWWWVLMLGQCSIFNMYFFLLSRNNATFIYNIYIENAMYIYCVYSFERKFIQSSLYAVTHLCTRCVHCIHWIQSVQGTTPLIPNDVPNYTQFVLDTKCRGTNARGKL